MLLGNKSCVAEGFPSTCKSRGSREGAVRGTSHVTSDQEGWRYGVSGIWRVTLYSHTWLPERSRTFLGCAVGSDTESPSVRVVTGWRV